MRISDAEVKKVLSHPELAVADVIVQFEEAQRRDQDQVIVQEMTAKVIGYTDREDMIADFKSRISSGTYRPDAEAILDGMARRAIADQVR